MPKKDRSFLMKLLLLPFTLIVAAISFAFWLLSFKAVRKYLGKLAKKKAEEKFVDADAREKKG